MTAVAYSWATLPKDHPMPLIARQRVIGRQMMLSRVELARGFRVATHQHENEQFAVVLSGRIRFEIGPAGAPTSTPVLGPGELIHLPSNVPHAAEAIEDTVVLDLFSPPSDKTGVDRR